MTPWKRWLLGAVLCGLAGGAGGAAARLALRPGAPPPPPPALACSAEFYRDAARACAEQCLTGPARMSWESGPESLCRMTCECVALPPIAVGPKVKSRPMPAGEGK